MDHVVTVAALALCAFLAAPVVGETCEELKAQCDELHRGDDGYTNRLLPSTADSSMWPVSAADLQKYRPFGDAYCRRGVDLGNCMKKLYSRCLEEYDREKSVYNGWYGPEWQIITGGLCNTTIGPVKFFRAVTHCSLKNRSKFFSCCFLKAHAPHEQNGNAAVAHQNICAELKATVERLSGADGAEIGGKCGQDAVDTLKEAHEQLQAGYCSKS
ncbi:uncharacterized protein LOC129591489 [Paramacrobiotus metropolitanus]|uniref:uncharacterized protein LOC129591489 n=1 Tax=Paramacrobiotus metropolitanus TaxID=2943436 RepID=UPI00244600F6|nr:uncharacterized protein LOC129591489 [Paramacrobiotus metropolitanus]